MSTKFTIGVMILMELREFILVFPELSIFTSILIPKETG